MSTTENLDNASGLQKQMHASETDLQANDYFDALKLLLTESSGEAKEYRQLRFLLEQFVRQFTSKASYSFPNLFARLSFMAELPDIPVEAMQRLHEVRINCKHHLQNALSSDGPITEELSADIARMAYAVAGCYATEIPHSLQQLLPQLPAAHSSRKAVTTEIEQIRATFLDKEGEVLVVLPHDMPDRHPIRVTISERKEEAHFFKESLSALTSPMQINLLQVRFCPERELYEAAFLVIEPDYLIDISTLAECFKDYGAHPLTYWIGRLSPSGNNRHLLLGHSANFFLDELLNETPDQPVSYGETMYKLFCQMPLAFSACPDLQENESDFFSECKQQFEQIKAVIQTLFPIYQIAAEKAILEPAFICEPLGIQGRLDLLSSDFGSFIELKSGKANQLYPSPQITYKENHYVQMMLYYAVLHFTMGVSGHQTKAYLFYSKYGELYKMGIYWGLIKQAIDLRNRIVAIDYQIQHHNSTEYTHLITSAILPDQLNLKNLNTHFWHRYLSKPIADLAGRLDTLADCERAYVDRLITFICKEQYIAKCGGEAYDSQRSANSLWSLSEAEKKAAGEMLSDLRMVGNETLAGNQQVSFEMPVSDNQTDSVSNFREGDMVIIYRHDLPQASCRNSQLVKGAIFRLSATHVTVSLRIRQRNPQVLHPDYLYAIERDYLDVGFQQMFRGVGSFLTATPRRRQLLLAQRSPESQSQSDGVSEVGTIDQLVEKALQCRDYFLLVGPPGTGKTSQALRRMVEQLLYQTSEMILLVAYTNKAVDEICESLEQIDAPISYIRIGQEAACNERYRPRLLKNRVANCRSRKEVVHSLSQTRLFTATLTSLCAQPELFSLIRFDTVIVDEASQILEPQLLPLLCATTSSGADAIGRFILIGDHKQLPAIVLQSEESSVVTDPILTQAGVRQLNQSLFERLYRLEQNRPYSSPFIATLTQQGRMHPEISHFPSRYFYDGLLTEIPLPHQLETLPVAVTSDGSFWDHLVSSFRLGFIPLSVHPSAADSFKSNEIEAACIARLATAIYRREKQLSRFDPATQLGIITPYRSQIACIRKALYQTGIDALQQVTIDTVERFQGSQRDVILYSCCINSPFQLTFMGNRYHDGRQLIDRKLNVVITRARKQLFITGNPMLLNRDEVYRIFLQYIQNHGGWIDLPDEEKESLLTAGYFSE